MNNICVESFDTDCKLIRPYISMDNFKKFMFRLQNSDPESESMIQNKNNIYNLISSPLDIDIE